MKEERNSGGNKSKIEGKGMIGYKIREEMEVERRDKQCAYSLQPIHLDKPNKNRYHTYLERRLSQHAFNKKRHILK